jgi:hypothetical protein
MAETQNTTSQPAPATSRAINVDAPHADVVAMCAKHKASVSTIEDLMSGGTRVVLMNGTDAAAIRKAFGKKVIAGEVVRTRWLRNG